MELHRPQVRCARSLAAECAMSIRMPRGEPSASAAWRPETLKARHVATVIRMQDFLAEK